MSVRAAYRCCAGEVAPDSLIPRPALVEWNPSSPFRDHNVAGLLSDPRRVAAALEAQDTMPGDAKERLRKARQSCLRKTLVRDRASWLLESRGGAGVTFALLVRLECGLFWRGECVHGTVPHVAQA